MTVRMSALDLIVIAIYVAGIVGIGCWAGLRRARSPILIQQGFAVPGGDPLGHFGSGLEGARRTMPSS